MSNPQNTTDFNYYLKTKLDEAHDRAETYRYLLDNIHARAIANPNNALSRYVFSVYKDQEENVAP